MYIKVSGIVKKLYWPSLNYYSLLFLYLSCRSVFKKKTTYFQYNIYVHTNLFKYFRVKSLARMHSQFMFHIRYVKLCVM